MDALLSLRWLFLRNKGLFKRVGHFDVDFISWIYICHIICSRMTQACTYEDYFKALFHISI